ncbi:TPA: CpaF family protein [Candidatus Woesearchaeota archaeon]|nr:CpaF family protein [Candidatus Woesearchaeota archaeon]
MSQEVLETYRITDDGFDVEVRITGGAGRTKKYELVHHEIQPGTLALLDQVKQELIGTVRMTAEELLDPKTIHTIKQRFKDQAKLLIQQKLPGIHQEMENLLVMTLLKEMLGLGEIEVLLNDPFLEEIIIISSSEPIRVFHKKHGWIQTNIHPVDELQIRDNLNTIARRVGRQITNLSPLLDAHLITGDRANAVLYPISSKGNALTIRKFARDPWTVTDFIKNNTCSAEIFALIWFVIQYESNILISGGTGSGKTSLLNVCMPFIPPNQRIISIEDTRELTLPEFLHWCPLTVRQPNPEGKGEVTMLDLLINSLRMRPDRIILGEMRKKEQAEVLFEAMHTGHSVYATVHADSVAATIQRLINPPIEVPTHLLSAVNLNVVMFRNRRLNVRRVYQVGEFLPAREEGENIVKPNIIYRWNPANDKIVAHQKPLRLFEELSRHTGLNETEIEKDLSKKEKILTWMVNRGVRDITSVGKIFQQYYLDPERLVQVVTANADPKTILQEETG